MAEAITPRKMVIDFHGLPARWSRSLGFSIIHNAASPLATAFEPYLNRIMARVRDTLPESKSHIKRDIDLFIAQERNHYRVHTAFNKALFKVYPDLKIFEENLAQELNIQAKDQSLEYNMAWACGFENLACYNSKFNFTKSLSLWDESDERVRTMLLWHNAEEFEHRSACSDAFKALSGNYRLRVRGLTNCMEKVMTYHKDMIDYICSVEREVLSDIEYRETVLFIKSYNRMFAFYVFPRMVQIFLPYYDPARQTAPDILHRTLDRYQEMIQSHEPVAV